MQHTSHTTRVLHFSAVDNLLRRCIAAAREQALIDREHWFLWLPVGLASGIGIWFAADRNPPLVTGAATAVILLCAGIAQRPDALRRGILLLLATAAAGFQVVALTSEFQGTAAIEKPVRLIGATADVVSIEEGERSLHLRLQNMRTQDGRPIAPGAVNLYAASRLADELAGAVRIRFDGRLSPPDAPDFPGAPDPQRRAWFEGLSASGFAWRVERIGSEAQRFDPVAGLRHAMGNALRARLPEREGGIAIALTIGERRGIAGEDLSNLRDSGLAHLLAISGLHVGLVAGMAFFTVRLALVLLLPVGAGHAVKKVAAGAAIPVALLYMLMAGATVPTQRAFLMAAVTLGAVITDRQAISLRTVAIAACAVLTLDPHALTGPSFQMSFAAVTLIVALYERLGEPLRTLARGEETTMPAKLTGWLILMLLATILSTLAANIATAPFAAHHFGRISIVGLLANLVAVPVAAYVVMPALLGFALLAPLGLGYLPAALAEWGIGLLLRIAEVSADLPFAVIEPVELPTAPLLMLVGGTLWLVIWRQNIRWAGILPLAAGLSLALLQPAPLMIIHDKGGWVAVRGEDGSVIHGPDRADAWLRRRLSSALARSEPPSSVVCDNFGCQLAWPDGPRVSYAFDGNALLDDCRVPGLLVSREPVRRSCRGPGLIIDRFDLWRDGAHAIYPGKPAPGIRSVRNDEGCRPWSRLPGCRENGQ